MKNFTLLFFLILTTLGYGQITIPVDFESTTINYSFVDFDGGQLTLENNPDMSGMNMSGKVAKMVKNTGQPWGGSLMELDAPIDFSTNKTFKMKVWAPTVGTKVLLKVENLANGAIFFEKEAETTTAMAWEELTFDFSAVNTAESYQKIVLIFELGTVGDGSANFTYYLDDIDLVFTAPVVLPDLPITFEDPMLDYNLVDFGGNASEIVTDPTDPNNIVGKATKLGDAMLWAGTTNGGDGLANPVPFSMGNTKMSVRVWSPDAGTPIRLKAEDASNGAISVETEAMTTMAGMWETLEFDFNNQVAGTAAINFANTYNMVSIFFNFGTDGATAGEKTYYWDDVMFVTGGGGPTLAQVDLPITFEDTMTVDYALVDFGGNVSEIVTDPTDPNNIVGKATKLGDAMLWAGTTNGGGGGLANPVPFSMGNTKMSVRVWSPDAGTPIRLKAEDASNGAISVETEAMTTMAGMWETLEFDFNNQVAGTAAINFANTYNMVSIFFNFGTDGATAGEKTYYWDDVMFIGGGGGPTLAQVDLPITFEDTMTVDYALVDFGGNVSEIVTDPTDPNNIVGKATKLGDAMFWAGTTNGGNGLATAIPFATGETKMSVRVWSPDAGTPIRLKVEDASNGAISVETEVTTTMAGMWETLEFDFSNNVGGTSAINFANTYNLVSIFFNFGIDGANVGEKTYYWDDVMFIGGGGGPVLDPVDLPITFQDTATVDYGLVDFGGNASEIVTDPTDPDNLVGKAIKTDMAELWAGTTNGGNGLANPVPFAMGDTKMTVRVWSPDAGIPIRLKAEDATNPAISVETEANTTVAQQWETLEFDFSNEAAGTAAIDFANTYDKISIFFNFGTTGATAGEKTYYWDDVEFGPRTTVVDIIVNSPDHETLETAVIAAQLDDDLSAAGPFTVFAPTDNAFANLPTGVLDDLLANPTGDLVQVLLYHVLAARVMSGDLSDGQVVPTLQGADVDVTITGGDVFINQALVTAVDLEADNGVVHVIDAVLMLPVGVEVINAAEAGVKISPNPTNAFFNIEFPETLNESVNMMLFDMNGKLLKEGVIADQISKVDVSDLNSGMYFLRMDTGEVSYYQKVIVTK